METGDLSLLPVALRKPHVSKVEVSLRNLPLLDRLFALGLGQLALLLRQSLLLLRQLLGAFRRPQLAGLVLVRLDRLMARLGDQDDAGRQGDRRGDQQDRRRADKRPVPPGPFRRPVRQRRRPGLDRLVVQVTLHVPGEIRGRLVTPRAVLFQGLHHDPVQVAAELATKTPCVHAAVRGDGRDRLCIQRAQAMARRGWLFLPDHAADFVEAGLAEPLVIKRRAAGQKLV